MLRYFNFSGPEAPGNYVVGLAYSLFYIINTANRRLVGLTHFLPKDRGLG